MDVGRLVTPSFRAWHMSGDVLARLAQSEQLNLGNVTKAGALKTVLTFRLRHRRSAANAWSQGRLRQRALIR
jgi:hypothetical protein